jgi:hypothetical protein
VFQVINSRRACWASDVATSRVPVEFATKCVLPTAFIIKIPKAALVEKYVLKNMLTQYVITDITPL